MQHRTALGSGLRRTAVEVIVIKCPNCGRDNAANFNFCLDCGYDLKAFREAFPDGMPTVPPPPAPAMTNPAGMAMPINLPNSMTPQSVASPLPPLPRSNDPGPLIPSTPPPSMAPHVPMAQPPAPHAPMPQPPAPMPQPPAPAATFPPMPPMEMPAPPANLPSTYTPGPSPAPAAMSTSVLSSSPMPAPAPTSAPAPVTTPPEAPIAAPSAPVPANLPNVPTPMPAMPPVASPAASTTPTAAVRTCAACGYENAASVKFCGNCGKRLDGAAPAPAAGAPEGEGVGRTMFMHAAETPGAVKEKLCKLVTIDQAGREGMTFTIKSGETVCGRVNGVILFFDDPFVSPTHCKFAFHNGTLKVIDMGSLNGVYMRVKQERRLADGELIRLGRQLFRFESMKMAAFQVKKADGDDSRIWGSPATQAFGRLVQILDDGRTGEIRLLSGERAQIGREIGDIVIPTDGFISGRHCVFMLQNGEPVLSDLGSSNGTYVRVREEADVAHGDFVLVGNQMLRVEIV